MEQTLTTDLLGILVDTLDGIDIFGSGDKPAATQRQSPWVWSLAAAGVVIAGAIAIG